MHEEARARGRRASRRTANRAITPRAARFPIQGTELHWADGDPQLTHTVNTLSLLLPAGEKWFVQMFRKVLPLLDDEELRAQVRGFIGQEASHAVAHTRVLDLFAAQGIDVAPFTAELDWLFEKALADRPLGVSLPASLERAWLLRRLALIAAIEHFTTMMGAWVLEAEQLSRVSRSKAMMELLLWHGAEEVEHRCVAFDVFEHLGGGYVNRVTAMGMTVTALTYFWVRGVTFMMKADPTQPGRASWRTFFRHGKRGILPTLHGDAARAIARYLNPWHHPSKEHEPESTWRVLGNDAALSMQVS